MINLTQKESTLTWAQVAERLGITAAIVPLLLYSSIAIIKFLSKIESITVCDGLNGIGCSIIFAVIFPIVALIITVVLIRKLLRVPVLKAIAITILASTLIFFVSKSGVAYGVLSIVPATDTSLIRYFFITFLILFACQVVAYHFIDRLTGLRRIAACILVVILVVILSSYSTQKANENYVRQTKEHTTTLIKSIDFTVYKPTYVIPGFNGEVKRMVDDYQYSKDIPQPWLTTIFNKQAPEYEYYTVRQFLAQESYRPPADCRPADPLIYFTVIESPCSFLGTTSAGNDVYMFREPASTGASAYMRVDKTMLTFTTTDYKVSDEDILKLFNSFIAITPQEIMVDFNR